MLEEARAELTTAESAVVYLKQVVSGLEGLLKTSPAVAAPAFAGEMSPAPQDDEQASDAAESEHVYPRTPAAVLEVLRSRPNFPMTFKQIWAEMTARNLIDPAIKSGRNAYTVSARRLAENKHSGVIRDEHDRYVYRTEPADPMISSLDRGEEANPMQLVV
jgi:hypothetical protein